MGRAPGDRVVCRIRNVKTFTVAIFLPPGVDLPPTVSLDNPVVFVIEFVVVLKV